mmetsp:Transcript_56059/g.151208  ORF Transcript_56059/g.151208 Transcript_56059/m.151208 type:complete len:144 (-) Transcript_56059:305-736(-)
MVRTAGQTVTLLVPPVLQERGQALLGQAKTYADDLRSDPQRLLYACIVMDMIGFSSYLVLFLGELVDIYWAPIFFLFMQYMFGSMLMSSVGCLEELLPFTDIVPTATIAWCLAHCDWPAFEFLRQLVGLRRMGAARAAPRPTD